jgi:hypothetical protein
MLVRFQSTLLVHPLNCQHTHKFVCLNGVKFSQTGFSFSFLLFHSRVHNFKFLKMLGRRIFPLLVSNNGQISPIPSWDLAPQSLLNVSTVVPQVDSSEETVPHNSQNKFEWNLALKLFPRDTGDTPYTFSSDQRKPSHHDRDKTQAPFLFSNIILWRRGIYSEPMSA